MASFSSVRPPLGRLPGSRVGEMLDHGISASNKLPQARSLLTGPVAVLWDIENCPVPGEVNAEDVAGNVRMALRVHPAVKGAVTMFSAYGDFNHFPRKLREGCQKTGVNLIDVPNGKKDASDKAILVDMFLFALDNPPPCTILLISGDVDFAPALHKLGQRGYTVVLAIPASVGVSSVLCNAGRFVWDWPSVARGEGLVPAKVILNRSSEDRMTEFSAYMNGPAWQSSDESDFFTEDERYVYNSRKNSASFLPGHVEASQFSAATGLTHGGAFPFDFSTLEINQVPIQSTGLPIRQHLQMNQAFSSGKVLPNSISACSHAMQKQGDVCPNAEAESFEPWVQPGDLEGLKGQLMRLVKLNGGKLPLLRIPSEYCKLFGRPLYLSEYGSPKLVHLIERMPDAFLIKGEGNKRILQLKEHVRTQTKHRRVRANTCVDTIDSTQVGKSQEALTQILGEEEEFAEEIIFSPPQLPEICSDDDKACKVIEKCCEGTNVFECPTEEGEVSDGEEYMADVRLEVLRQEVQELLVSHAWKIPLLNFQTLYKQRYAHELDLADFGVEELEALFVKLEDEAVVKVDKETGRKFLVAKLSVQVKGEGLGVQ